MKDFIPYEQSLELKELGFDEPCFGWYSNMEGNVFRQGYCETYLGIENCAKAPLYQQAFRWFREKYFIHCEIGRDFDTWDYELYDFKSGNKHIPTGFKTFNTYEEAELTCLKKLIEIVKTKQL